MSQSIDTFSKAWWEKNYPLLFSLVLTGIFGSFHKFIDLLKISETLFPVIVSISAIAVGFLLTAKSILVSIDDRKIILHLKQMGLYSSLVGYLIHAVRWCFATVVVTALGMLLGQHSMPWYLTFIYLTTWVFVTGMAGGCCFRIVSIFSSILKDMARRSEQDY